MKNNDASSGAAGWGSEPRRLTPLDIQEKQFGSARLRTGYLMHEVDEFLDEVTDTLSALIAENERLRRGASAGPPTPAPAATSDADRAAVDAFLRREKGFLENLGSLVQTHAEELKSMVRSARAGAAAAATPTLDTTTEPPPAEEASDASESAAASDRAPEPAPAEEPVSHDEPGDVEAGPGDDEDEASSTITGVVAEEPIRLEEPQPASRSRRAEDESEGSLRELFWGEE